MAGGDVTDRCHGCDMPLAGQAEYERYDDVLGHAAFAIRLCWRDWHGDVCQNSPVDWRARCLAMQQVVEAAERWMETPVCAGLASAVRAYRAAKDSK